MKTKKILALLLTLGLGVAMLSGCGGDKSTTGTESSSAPAKDGASYVVGTNPTFAPFEFQDDSGKMSGFDLDLIQAIGEEEGFTVEFKSLNFDALSAAVQNGEIDIIASGVSITPDRVKQIAFSKPYMDASLGIYVGKENSDVKSIDDLKDKVVAAQSGTTGAEEAQKLQEEGKIGEAKILDDYNQCFLEIKNGSADAILIDVPVAESYLKDHPDTVKMVGEPYAADFYGIGVKKDNKELVEKINAGLDKIIKNGKYEELCKKYNLIVPQSIVDGTAKVPGQE